jgi:hypothetical protein
VANLNPKWSDWAVSGVDTVLSTKHTRQLIEKGGFAVPTASCLVWRKWNPLTLLEIETRVFFLLTQSRSVNINFSWDVTQCTLLDRNKLLRNISILVVDCTASH